MTGTDQPRVWDLPAEPGADDGLDGDEKIAMTPAAVEVRARMAREWAERVAGGPSKLPWTVRQHFEVDVPKLLETVLRLALEKRAAQAVLDEIADAVAEADAETEATARALPPELLHDDPDGALSRHVDRELSRLARHAPLTDATEAARNTQTGDDHG